MNPSMLQFSGYVLLIVAVAATLFFLDDFDDWSS